MRLTLILIVLGAFALRLINLTFQPLWFDEGWSVWFATSDLPTMAARTAADIHPPFYYAVLHFWIALCGSSEFSLRLLSLLIGVLSVSAIYRLAKELCDATVGRVAALLVAVSPLYVFYSQEIRMYGLVTLLGLVSSWFFWRAMRRETAGDKGNKGRYWIAYVLVTSAAMWTQYYGALIPLCHFVFFLVTACHRRTCLLPFGAFIALCFLYLPWLLYAASQLTEYVAAKVSEEKYLPLAPLEYVMRHLVAFAAGHLPSELAWFGSVALLFTLLALSGVTAPRATRHASLFLSLYFIVPFIAGYLIQLRFPFAPPRMERLLLLASPPFLILVARGLAQVNFRFQISDFRLKNLGAVGVLATLLITSAISLFSFYTVPRYPEQDYRALANRINALALSSDVVILVHPWQVGFLQAYLNVPVSLQMVAEPAWGDADQAQLDAALNANRRVWLPAYQSLGRILEREMQKYLARNALNVESKWYETTLLSFYAPAPKLTQIGSFTLSAGHGSVFSAQGNAYTSGWDVVPLRILLFTSITQGVPPAVSLRLKDGRGQVWASQDRRFVRADDTSFSDPLFAGSFGFLVPAGTPPGLYELQLALYDPISRQSIGSETSIYPVQVFAPETPPAIAALPIQTTFVADWPDVRLLGYTLRDGAWQAGESLHLDLFWQALDTTSEERKLFVQLQDTQGNVFARNEAKATYPMSRWQRGELIREQRDLLLPATLAPGKYRVVVGFLRADQQTRLGLTRGGDQVVLREIEVVVRPHRFDAPAAQVKQNIRFADLAKIVGHDFVQNAQSQSLMVRLYWQAVREMNASYKVFVHVIAPDGKTLIAQHDSIPVNGNVPTTSWVSGEYIADEHAILLPPTSAPGFYRVLVGLYDPQNGTRVKAFDASDGAYRDDAAELLQFELK